MTDLVTAEQAAEDLAQRASGLEYAIAAADALEITTPADVELAAELLGQLKKAISSIETRRKELSLPLTRVAREINEAAKQQSGPLTTADLRLRNKVRAYHEEQAEARAAAEAQAQAASGQKVVDPGELPSQMERRVQVDSGSLTLRSRWTHEVVDLQALCKAASTKKGFEEFGHFLMAAPSEIGAFVKAGGRELPGVRIYETSDPVVKAA